MDTAAATVHGNAVIAVVGTDGGCQLQVGMRAAASAEFALDDDVGLFKRLIYIALVQHIVTDNVRGGTFA